jgi:uncharacterized protein (TIGR02680 family)
MTPVSPTALPRPSRQRWQALRLGLIELYHYDAEEFWLRDGHLLLRGNNGTGKSKVLSLTLPFLLDANLSSARLEPDGDRSKRMEWNLLMGGRHERRVGYSWMELGRLDEDGNYQYLTLGAGLRAVAGRGGVDAWYFTSDQRVGETLWLTTQAHTAVAKDRLRESIGEHGQIYDTATDYRRAVDETLFGLGPARYAALIDTLIQLRQPQLSKQPNEQRLSDALTEALPPLDRTALEDIAEAMNQLEDYRRELAELETLRKAVASFTERYRHYAQIATRRRAGELRAAQTHFDNASRELRSAEAELASARTALESAETRSGDCETALDAARARLSILRADPVMRDAARLHQAETDLQRSREQVAEAERRTEIARQRLNEERRQLASRVEEAERTRVELREILASARRLAGELGLASSHEETLHVVASPDAVAELGPEDLDSVRGRLREAVKRRSEEIALVRKRLAELAAAAQKRELALSEREARADEHAAAEEHLQTSNERLRSAAAALVVSWQRHLSGLQVLQPESPEAALEALADWVETLAEANPVRTALEAAARTCERDFANQAATLQRQQEEASAERATLLEERQRLETGEDSPPPALYFRDRGDQQSRPGAAFWQLVDFDPELPDSQRAGIEAALEAAGLLDAWLTPQGVLLDPESGDARLRARAPRPRSLAGPLRACSPPPGAVTPVTPEVVTAVLASIDYADDDSGDAEAWVSASGAFRLGPLSGRWSKTEAQYIGYAARLAARQRRLAVIAEQLTGLDSALAALATQQIQIEALRAQAQTELAESPTDDSLRGAHATVAVAERQRRDAQQRLGEADGRLAQAEHAWQRARDGLTLDAEDLHLPAEGAALEGIARSLDDYRAGANELVANLAGHRRSLAELVQQQQREARSQVDLVEAESSGSELARGAREALTILETLRESVGEQVLTLERRIRETEDQQKQQELGLKAALKALNVATADGARAEQKLASARILLEQRSSEREAAIEHLRGFAATGLFAIAAPTVELPQTDQPWGVEAGVVAARRAEQALQSVAYSDEDWNHVQHRIGEAFNDLGGAMAAQGHSALAEPSDNLLIVRVLYQQRPERPDLLTGRLDGELSERRALLTAREREVLENHLQQDIAVNLQRLIQDTERRVSGINAELAKRPTSTGVRYKLEWAGLPDDDQNSPAGLNEARKRLLKTSADAWSSEDRRLVGEFLQARIQAERIRDDQVALFESLSRALDYRRWHRFRVKRWQDGSWKPLSGPASGGERALGLTVPLFAAASSHYESAHEHAPRLVLLDEAFAGIDDEARASCMGLINEFDLDFVMTSEREWGCYPELPGLAICQLVRREGIDAVFVSRWSWDGNLRRAEPDPARRFPGADQDAESELTLG